MKEYFDFVESLAIKKENKVFFNSGPIHAAIVMSRIFEYSENEINIFCGGFSGAVSNDPTYLACLENFLKKDNSKIRILVEDYDKNQNSKIYSVLKKYSKKVELFETKERVVNTSTNKQLHFTIGDKRMLRLETNPDDFTAQVNFNISDDSNFVINLFDKMYSNTSNKKIVLD